MAYPNYGYPPESAYSSSGHGEYGPNYGSNGSYAQSPDPGRRDSHGGGYEKVYYDHDRQSQRSSKHKSSSYDDNSDTPSSSEDERTVRRSSRKDGKKSGSSRSKSANRPLDKAKDHFSSSDRGVGAGMIGAVAGAVIAQEAAHRNGKGSIGATIAGLVLGGLAGNAMEKGYDK
ncbi:hypothetical protein P7C71_g4901, partial [Lecanoromycetidae sp. Uapishka_2]